MSSTTSLAAILSLFVIQLGSPRYLERELATEALRQLLPASADHLHHAENSIDPEISLRASVVLEKYYAQTAAAKAASVLPTGYAKLPWIDQLPPDFPNRESVVAQYLPLARRQVGHSGPPVWEDYRRATRLYVRDLFARRWTVEQVRELLDRMVDQEVEWIRRNGGRYQPPIPVPEVRRPH